MKYSLLTTLLLVSSTFAAPTPANSDKLRRANGPVKENSYIVKLKKGKSLDGAIKRLNELVFADDAESQKEVHYSNWKVVNAYSATLTGKALEAVLSDPEVEFVEEDGVVKIDSQPHPVVVREGPPTGNVSIDAANTFPNGLGVTLYGIDTGIRTTHSAFEGRARWGAVFGYYSATDGNGHGTHTAGTMAGVGFGYATKAEIVAVKVLDDYGSGYWSDVIAGIDWVVWDCEQRCIVNLSLGGYSNETVDEAVRNAISRGIHFTVSAGNSSWDAQYQSPARVTQANTVGAVDIYNYFAWFSNYGLLVDVHALGVDVASAWNTNDEATATLSGTSMSAPRVAGILAVAISRRPAFLPEYTPAELSAALIDNAPPLAQGVPSDTTKLVAQLWPKRK